VHFSATPHSPGRYVNKRAEMAFDAVAWIKRGGALPESRELLQALTETTYTFKGDKLILEPKDMLKERLGFSPDEFDAFILTFAEPISPRGLAPRLRNRQVQAEYDPYREPERPRDEAGAW
jgi:phage terminase large subunit